MKVLVTGGTGLLGNNIIRLLVQRGDDVRCLVRKGHDERPFEGLQVELVEADLSETTDNDSIHAAIEGVDVVIHAAGVVHIGWSRMELAQRVNVAATQAIAAAARRNGTRMVYISTVNALGLPDQPSEPCDETSKPSEKRVRCTYVESKIAAEAVIQGEIAQGLNACILHPGYMLGPWDWKPSSGRMLLTVGKMWTPISPRGGCSVCDVRDVAAGVVNAIEQTPSNRYILAGQNMSYHDLWTLMAEEAGSRPPVVVSRGVAPTIGAAFGDFWCKFTGKEPELNSASLKMSRQHHYYSSDLAQAELGYQTRAVKESIHDAWEWFGEWGYR